MDGSVHRISVSVVFGIPVSLQPSVELKLLLLQCSSEDVVELSQTVLNFDESGLWIGQSALRGELFTLRLCSRLPSMPAVPSSRDLSVIRVGQHRPHHPLKSSPFSLIRTLLLWMGETLSFLNALFRRTHDTRIDGTCQRGLLVSSRGFRRPLCGVHLAQKSELRAHQMVRKCEVPGSPRTKIRAELSSNGSDVRPVGLTPHKKSTPKSYGMGIVLCISNGTHRLPPRCPLTPRRVY